MQCRIAVEAGYAWGHISGFLDKLTARVDRTQGLEQLQRNQIAFFLLKMVIFFKSWAGNIEVAAACSWAAAWKYEGFLNPHPSQVNRLNTACVTRVQQPHGVPEGLILQISDPGP